MGDHRSIRPRSETEFRIGENEPSSRKEAAELAKPEWRAFLWRSVEESLATADPSHDILHIDRVSKNSHQIARVIGLNSEEMTVVDATVLGHDYKTHSKNLASSRRETEESADLVINVLKQTNFPPHLLPQVHEGVVCSSLKLGKTANSIPGLVTAFADKLDQTGAVFVMRYAASSGVYPMIRKHYNRKDPFGKKRELKEFQFTLDALVARRPKIEKLLNSGFVRDTAAHRNSFVDLFNHELEIEIQEEKRYAGEKWLSRTGASSILNYFKRAGRYGKQFYDLDDPLCQKGQRDLRPEKFPIDALISIQRRIRQGENFGAKPEILQRRAEFIEKFFKELESELEGELVYPDVPEPHKIRYEPEIPQ